MATKSTRYLDAQGRIILPNHIRKALNLNSGNCVEVELDDDGTIRIRATKERCVICGNPIEEGMPTAELSKDKRICYSCAQAVAKAMLN